MTIRAGFFGTTTKAAVSSTASTFTVEGAPESRHAFIVSADVPIHLTRTPAGVTLLDATVANGIRVAADTMVAVNTFAGDRISYVVGDGDAETGSVWFSKTDH